MSHDTPHFGERGRLIDGARPLRAPELRTTKPQLRTAQRSGAAGAAGAAAGAAGAARVVATQRSPRAFPAIFDARERPWRVKIFFRFSSGASRRACSQR